MREMDALILVFVYVNFHKKSLFAWLLSFVADSSKHKQIDFFEVSSVTSIIDSYFLRIIASGWERNNPHIALAE